MPTYATGNLPTVVVDGDLNNDGKTDLVVLNNSPDSYKVFLGNGDGTFNPLPEVSIGSSFLALALADLNEDGKLDLVSAKTLQLGNGDGTFQGEMSLGVLGAHDVAVGDFNGDGHMDVATVRGLGSDPAEISVLLGRGDGTFQPKIALQSGFTFGDLAVADLNHDGLDDIVVTQTNAFMSSQGEGPDGAFVFVYLSNGGGSFSQSTVSSENQARTGAKVERDVVLHDFNGDGFADAAVGNGDDGVTILLNHGDGTFATPTFYAVPKVGKLDIGDINGDGKMDLVAGNTENGYVSFLLGNGDGTFGLPLLSTASNGYGLAVGNFDGNPLADVAATVLTYDRMDVLVDPAGGTFQGLAGTDGPDTLTGDHLAGESLYGLGGADVLEGRGGNPHLLYGGPGDDVYITDNISGVRESVGEGRDIILLDASGVLPDWTEVEVVAVLDPNGGGAFNITGNYLDNSLYGNAGNNQLNGGGGNDYLVGLAGSDTLHGGSGDDALDGGTGDDVLFGDGGTDYLAGGPGDDTYYLESPPVDTVYEAQGEGIDRVIVYYNYTLPAGSYVEFVDAIAPASIIPINLTGNELANTLSGNNAVNVLNGGAGNDTLYGFDGNDTLNGGDGDDVLDGGAGTDQMSGGLGNDTYFVDRTADSFNEAVGQGKDIVITSVSLTLAAGNEIETLQGAPTTAALTLTGNAYTTTIIGNAGADTLNGVANGVALSGLAGNDTLNGTAGDDVLDGGTGADHLNGGQGNDYYVVDNAGDVFSEVAGQGFDRVAASISLALAPGNDIEILTTANDASTAAINLTGNDVTQSIYGNAGANILTGGENGNYLVGLGGDDTLNGNGGEDALDGGDGKDVLNGGAGADYLVGGAGDDLLDGGAGADKMFGGTGNDYYRVDDPGDVVGENAGQGADIVATTISYALAAGNEIETLSTTDDNGTSAINLAGNEIANSIYGNAGVNGLSGGGGNDYLVGLGGGDFLNGGDGQDALDGGAGDDNLNGGADADYLVGGAGGDYFAFSDALGPGNIDRIADFSHGADHIALDDAVFTGLATGSLPASAFVVGTAAQDADDRIIYDSTTGALYFDADGSGAGAAVQFATLMGAPTNLSASDFLVY